MEERILSDKLRELRKLHGYTQDYVAIAIGIVRQTYGHYETGRRTPGAAALYKLAGLYGIPISDLMQLTVAIDRDISYDAPEPTQSGDDLADFIAYCNKPDVEKRIGRLNMDEKAIIYYMSKLDMKEKAILVDIAKVIVSKK